MKGEAGFGIARSSNVADVVFATHRRRIGRKIAAVLAGGLLLGVGAITTQASWSDSEYATSMLPSGVFRVEGTTDALTVPYQDYSSTGFSSTLELNTHLVDMGPGDMRAAAYWIRLGAGTGFNGILTVSDIETTDQVGSNSATLSYEVYLLQDDFSCNVMTPFVGEGPVVASAPNLVTGAPTSFDPSTLVRGAPVENPGTAVQLCVVVTGGPSSSAGAVTDTAWHFRVVSL